MDTKDTRHLLSGLFTWGILISAILSGCHPIIIAEIDNITTVKNDADATLTLTAEPTPTPTAPAGPPPTKVLLNTPPGSITVDSCTALSVSLTDDSGTVQNVTNNVEITPSISVPLVGDFFSDSSCLTKVVGVWKTVTTGNSLNASPLYFRSYYYQTGAQITVAGTGLTSVTHGFATIPPDPLTAGQTITMAFNGFVACANSGPNASVQCWGAGNTVPFGDNDSATTARLSPTAIVGIPDPVIHLSVANDHMCAVTNKYAGYCWGANASYQLGDGTNAATNIAIHVTVVPDNIKELNAYSGTTCALLNDGTVKCWGANNYGQLANGTTSGTPTATATDTGLTDAVHLNSPGFNAICAVLRDHTAKCWGYNPAGSPLGWSAPATNVTTPTQLLNFNNIDRISSDSLSQCLLLTDKSVVCLGSNANQILGTPNPPLTQTDSSTPFISPALPAGGADSLYMGSSSAACIINSGNPYCWGPEVAGYTGTPHVATAVPDLPAGGVRKIVVGGWPTIRWRCALLSGTPGSGDPKVQCWGANGMNGSGLYGVGIGVTGAVASPTTVSSW